MKALRASSVSALLMLALVGLSIASAGSESDPEVVDVTSDVELLGTVPVCIDAGLAGACLLPPASFADISHGWIESESASEIIFNIDGPNNANVYGYTEFTFHFNVGGVAYDAGIGMQASSLDLETPPVPPVGLGDGTIAPTGVASSARFTEDDPIRMEIIVPRTAIGSPAIGAVMTEIYITSVLDLANAVEGSFVDRAPDADFGRDYTFTMGGGTTDPNDTDGDGLLDSWEIEHFGDLSQNGTGDPDGDGLTNAAEQQIGTDPNNADTDGDGISDGDEFKNGTDPLDPNDPGAATTDSDGDGLDDDWEIEHFGDITSQDGAGDPDGDGCDNTCEQANGTDPNNADTDGDGFNDGAEVTAGTDPLDPDSFPTGTDGDADGDGLDDAWEITHFGNITAQDGAGDPDGDGCDNTCEQANGTDPNNADSDGDGFTDKEEVDAGSDPNDPNSVPASDNDKDWIKKVKDDWDYVAISGGLMFLIVLLGIVALAGRWS